MYTMNQLTIIGFTGNNAQAHYTQNGTLVVTISVATKESLEGRRTAIGRAEQTGTGLFLSGSSLNSPGRGPKARM